MPTRIVLDKATRAGQAAPGRAWYDSSANFFGPGLTRTPRGDDEENGRRANPSTPVGNSDRGSRRGAPSTRKRSIVNFRSSLLRELSVRGAEDRSYQEEDQSEVMVRLSSDDIRASPRLMGYLFAATAGGVMLVSVVQFYREEIIRLAPFVANQTLGDTVIDSLDNDEYYITSTGLVFRWKLWAAIYLSAGGVALSLLTFLVHFDTIMFPKLWVTVFRDGSLAERNWIFFLMLGWAAALHVATSTFSVGEYQANVYFTTWIAFAATALTYGVWRESAGLSTLNQKAIGQLNCDTTYNWLWTGIFAAIFAGSATDLYLNRDVVELRFKGEQLILQEDSWTIILAVTWAEVALCCLVIVFNEILFVGSWQFPFRLWGGKVVYRVIFGWRQCEGLIILASMGAKFYAILQYTGVDGVINGLSNSYFGIWGSFFNSVFAFGTWLHENEDLPWVIRDQAEHENEARNPRDH